MPAQVNPTRAHRPAAPIATRASGTSRPAAMTPGRAPKPARSAPSTNTTGRAPTTTTRAAATTTRHADPRAYSTTTGLAVQPAAGQPRYPEALPTESFYTRFPGAVGPTGNVVLTTEENDDVLLMINETVTVVQDPRDRNVWANRLTAEDVAKGGFLVYRPNSANPQYFTILMDGEEIYGSSMYFRASSN